MAFQQNSSISDSDTVTVINVFSDSSEIIRDTLLQSGSDTGSAIINESGSGDTIVLSPDTSNVNIGNPVNDIDNQSRNTVIQAQPVESGRQIRAEETPVNAFEHEIEQPSVDTGIITDTISIAKQVPVKESEESLLQSHELEPDGYFNWIPRNMELAQGWILGVLLFVLIMLAWVKSGYNRYFKLFMRAGLIRRSINELIDEDNALVQRISFVLSMIFTLVSALFIYQVSVFYQWDHPWLYNGFKRFIQFSLVIFLAYIIKGMAIRMMGYVVKMENISFEYILNTYLINNVLGLLLIPVTILISFSSLNITPLLVKLGLVIIIGAYSFRIIKGVILQSIRARFSIFYIILYLCTLEFLPLLIMVKLALPSR